MVMVMVMGMGMGMVNVFRYVSIRLKTARKFKT
jgi:F0F1-type ATP synthase assembly protein I